MKLTRIAIATVLVAAALTPVAAVAADSSNDGYAPVAGRAQQQVGPPQAGPNGSNAIPSATRTANNRLPFTGVDLALIAGVGALLGGMGLTLRRLARA